MSVYSQKQTWKIVLSLVALGIIAFSFWYTNRIAQKIANEERKKVELWAGAIQKKANLVKYTSELFDKLRKEERKKVELWAEATKVLAASNNISDYSFVLKVVADNTTVPVVLTDENGKIISHRNLDAEIAQNKESLAEEINKMRRFHEPIEITIYGNKKNILYYKDSRIFEDLKAVLDDIIKSFISEIVINSASVPVIFTGSDKLSVIAYGNIDSAEVADKNMLKKMIEGMASQNPPVEIFLSEGKTSYIFYKDSFLLSQLKYYPFIQLFIIGLFVLVSYWLFSLARKGEQNLVWVGMAKETAHQLGTPLSSMLAWMEILKSGQVSNQTIAEMEKDLSRLETITDRFSKIGSVPKLEKNDVIKVLNNVLSYVKTRSSEKVQFRLNADNELYVKLNIPLFEWVIENLLKNAIDAMDGEGIITIEVTDQSQVVYVDVTDTGKGIPSSKQNTVFQPGYTTKKRGWGLGLSLAKRIIDEYHNGKIFVKWSEPGKGTTFRIVLKK